LLNDNLIIPDQKSLQFYSVQTIQESLLLNTNTTSKAGTYLSIYFRKDTTYTLFQRNVQTLSDWLSYVGGFYKAIFAIGLLLSKAFSYELFVKSIMKRLYFIEEETSSNPEN